MNNYKDKINELKRKIDKLEENKKPQYTEKKQSGTGFAFKISTEILAALVVGVAIGLIVDNYFSTRPFGLIIFFILGAFAGFLNVYRVIRRIEKQE